MTCDRSRFSTGPSVSFTNKTDRHDITEILLKVALSTIKQTFIIIIWIYCLYSLTGHPSGHCDIAEILLKLVLSTYQSINQRHWQIPDFCLRLVYPMLPVSLDCPFWLPFRYSLTFIWRCWTILKLYKEYIQDYYQIMLFRSCLRAVLTA